MKRVHPAVPLLPASSAVSFVHVIFERQCTYGGVVEVSLRIDRQGSHGKKTVTRRTRVFLADFLVFFFSKQIRKKPGSF